MTDNQRRAADYLDQYRLALQELEYFRQRNDELRARAEGIKSSLGIDRGWTGKMIKVKRRGVIQGEKVMAPILGGKADPSAKSELTFALAMQTQEYDQRELEAIRLCQGIECAIDTHCRGLGRTALKYRYISLMTYQGIARRLHYSETQIRRLIYAELEVLGANLCHE